MHIIAPSCMENQCQKILSVSGYGEEGKFFQGDIRLTATSDPYDLYSDLYRRVFKRMAFDREGSGMSEDMLNSTSLSAQLWPGGRIPFVIDGSLRK